MKTFNYIYQDNQDLQSYIKINKFTNDKNVLIQIFTSVTIKDAILNILRLIKKQLPDATIIGATTDGEIIQGKVLEHQTIISFSVFENTSLKSQLYSYNDSHYSIGKKLAHSLISPDTKAIIVFADGLNTNADELLRGISEVNPTIKVAGGLAADYHLLKQTYVFLNDEIIDKGVVGVSLSSKDLMVHQNYIFEWKAIGRKMHVTKAIQNRLYEVDGIKLVDAYIKYLGSNVADNLPASAGEFPLIIERNKLHLARAALVKHSDGSMSYAGNFREGDVIQFGYGNIPQILNTSQEKIAQLNHYPLESIFIYSCSARKYFLQDSIAKELKPMENLAPSAGFFCYGEFFHSNNKCSLLNETMTLLGLSEGKASVIKPEENPIKEIVENNTDRAQDILFHLMNATGKELEVFVEGLELNVATKTKALAQQYYYDDLTQLPNINKLKDDLLGKSDFFSATLAIIYFDNLDSIRDFYGYKLSEKLIVKIVEILTDKLAINIYGYKLYKMGDHSLILAAHESIGEDTFVSKITELMRIFNFKDIEVEENILSINLVFGITFGKSKSVDFLEYDQGLLTQANLALKEAIDKKVAFMVYDNNLPSKKALEYNLLWRQKIKDALQEDRIVPFFQPIADSKTGLINKYECLVRMIENEKVISPFEFLEVAKKAKLYPFITKRMFSKSIQRLKGTTFEFSLNLTVADIMDKETINFIKKEIIDNEVGQQLILEIVESENINDYERMKDFIIEMKKLGCKIAIDDFGSGYSNFEHVIKLNADFIKIDGTLVKTIDTDPNILILVKTIIDFCLRLNIKTVAEFVHNETIFNIIKELGIDYQQGFYIGKPEKDLKI
ncbi:MAG: diguanylate cyclase/phosphodiesterase [Francisellaceae bacterium]|nr:diguanylate cyclase/phosphodiesterase [Francisellaceae bacterium]